VRVTDPGDLVQLNRALGTKDKITRPTSRQMNRLFRKAGAERRVTDSASTVQVNRVVEEKDADN
jgi:hypothetical protein